MTRPAGDWFGGRVVPVVEEHPPNSRIYQSVAGVTGANLSHARRPASATPSYRKYASNSSGVSRHRVDRQVDLEQFDRRFLVLVLRFGHIVDPGFGFHVSGATAGQRFTQR